MFDGLIDYGGSLRGMPSLDAASASPPCRIDGPKGLPGLLYAMTYQAGSGKYITCHYSDATFLRAYLQHPDFRMN